MSKLKLNFYKLYNILQNIYCSLPYYLGEGKTFPPIRYVLNTTLQCNLKCKFCYIGNKAHYEELSTQEWLDIIDQVLPYNLITFCGGEVTLKQNFGILLERALKKAKVSIITNGTLLDNKLINTFVEKKLFLIGLSLDGIKENHDKIRGVGGSFDKTVNSIEKINTVKKEKNSKFPLIDIKTVIINENLDELCDLYTLANSLNADFYTLSFLKGCDLQFFPTLKNEFSEEFYKTDYPVEQYLNMEHFEEIYKKLMDLSLKYKTKLRIYPEFDEIRSNKELAKIKRFYSKANEMSVKDVYHSCLYPWTDMFILPNGDVFPCLAYKVGNAKDTSLLKIWNNEKYSNFRRKLKENKMFKSCQSCCYSKIKDFK